MTSPDASAPSSYLGGHWHVTGEHTVAAGLDGSIPPMTLAAWRSGEPLTPRELADLADLLNNGAHPPTPVPRAPRLRDLLIGLAWLHWRDLHDRVTGRGRRSARPRRDVKGAGRASARLTRTPSAPGLQVEVTGDLYVPGSDDSENGSLPA